jgi:hypothetical protein
MTDLIEIDYQALTILIVGAFGLVGFFRGWWKEAVTTSLLTLLLLMLKVPAIGTTIVGIMDRVVGFVFDILQTVTESSEITASAVEVGPPPEVDPQRYWIYVITLIVLVLASYFIGKAGLAQELTAGGRLMGAILGFYNGFVAISLVREFVIGRFLPDADVVAATATPPSTVSIDVTNMPTESIADAPTAFFLIGIGFLILILVVNTGWSFERAKVKRRMPPGTKRSAGAKSSNKAAAA